jgi:hypothetical protein
MELTVVVVAFCLAWRLKKSRDAAIARADRRDLQLAAIRFSQ